MKQIATLKATQIAAKYGEPAPVLTLCCRNCATANAIAFGTAAVAGAAAGIARFARRFAKDT